MLFLAPSIYENLAHDVRVCGLVLFLAPSIYENMDIKKGILLQLFSGSQKDFDDSGRGKFRYDSDVILGFPLIFESPWKYLNFFLLNSRPWKYLKTGQVLESPWIHQVKLSDICNVLNNICIGLHWAVSRP